MSLPRKVFPFTARLVAGAPEQPGVYVLWQDDEAVYIGCALGGAATIRSRLVEHFTGHSGDCTRRASHYSWEISLKPAARELELLQEFRSAFRRAPRCMD